MIFKYVTTLSLFLSGSCFAAGITTYDIVNDFANNSIVQNTVNTYEQTVETVKNTRNSYETALNQYDNTLRQMQGLKERVKTHDYLSTLDDLSRAVTRSGNNQSLYTTDTWKSAKSQVDKLFGTSNTNNSSNSNNVSDEALSFVNKGGYNKESKDKAYNDVLSAYSKRNISISQQMDVSDNENILKSHQKSINEVNEYRNNLGDNDQLRTLQIIADQQQVQLDILQTMASTTNEQLKYNNLLDNEVMSRQANSATKIEESRRASQSFSYTPSNKKYVNF